MVGSQDLDGRVAKNRRILVETMGATSGCRCPTVDLAVADRVASPRSPTTILAEGGGESPEGIRFGIILHAREGLISELEVYPIDGEGPFSLPAVDEIEVYGTA
jgi:hypothetical protein